MIQEGDALFFRYWHLADDETHEKLRVAQKVVCGDCLGHLGNYRLGAGGDHLHFDLALDWFRPRWWFTNHQTRWVDPLEILKHRLGPDAVDVLVAR